MAWGWMEPMEPEKKEKATPGVGFGPKPKEPEKKEVPKPKEAEKKEVPKPKEAEKKKEATTPGVPQIKPAKKINKQELEKQKSNLTPEQKKDLLRREKRQISYHKKRMEKEMEQARSMGMTFVQMRKWQCAERAKKREANRLKRNARERERYWAKKFRKLLGEIREGTEGDSEVEEGKELIEALSNHALSENS